MHEVVLSFMSTSLEYIRLSHVPTSLALLERVQQLKYLYLNHCCSICRSALPTGCYSCLEQVYISNFVHSGLTEDDITTITSGGKITHAFLSCE